MGNTPLSLIGEIPQFKVFGVTMELELTNTVASAIMVDLRALKTDAGMDIDP